jgi:hypothetical protein
VKAPSQSGRFRESNLFLRQQSKVTYPVVQPLAKLL